MSFMKVKSTSENDLTMSKIRVTVEMVMRNAHSKNQSPILCSLNLYSDTIMQLKSRMIMEEFWIKKLIDDRTGPGVSVSKKFVLFRAGDKVVLSQRHHRMSTELSTTIAFIS